MGILENIREKVGSRVHEYQEGRARDKAEYKEHYNREFEARRKDEIAKSAKEKASRDAYNRVHPMENITKKLQGFGGDIKRQDNKGNSLARNLSPLGDFGRNIGHQYDNPRNHLPSALLDFDRPKRKR